MPAPLFNTLRPTLKSVEEIYNTKLSHGAVCEYAIDALNRFNEQGNWTNLISFPMDLSAEYPAFTCNDFENPAHVTEWVNRLKYAKVKVRENCNILLQRHRDVLALVAGESWTFGETVRTIDNAENYLLGLHATVGPQIAYWLNSDLHQYAIPGNSTSNIFKGVKKQLEYHREAKHGYKQIKIYLHITDIFRDLDHQSHITPGSPAYHIVDHFGLDVNNLVPTATRNNLPPEQAFEEWELIYLDWLESMLQEFADLNISVVLFKNFTGWATSTEQRAKYSFECVDVPWLQFLYNQYNSELLELPLIKGPAYVSDNTAFWAIAQRDNTWLNKQLDLVERDQLMGAEGIPNDYHVSHPLARGHMVWAEYITGNSK